MKTSMLLVWVALVVGVFGQDAKIKTWPVDNYHGDRWANRTFTTSTPPVNNAKGLLCTETLNFQHPAWMWGEAMYMRQNTLQLLWYSDKVELNMTFCRLSVDRQRAIVPNALSYTMRLQSEYSVANGKPLAQVTRRMITAYKSHNGQETNIPLAKIKKCHGIEACYIFNRFDRYVFNALTILRGQAASKAPGAELTIQDFWTGDDLSLVNDAEFFEHLQSTVDFGTTMVADITPAIINYEDWQTVCGDGETPFFIKKRGQYDVKIIQLTDLLSMCKYYQAQGFIESVEKHNETTLKVTGDEWCVTVLKLTAEGGGPMPFIPIQIPDKLHHRVERTLHFYLPHDLFFSRYVRLLSELDLLTYRSMMDFLPQKTHTVIISEAVLVPGVFE